ncbi:putative inactive G-type lectin S-receptor-like serine/threonine-protein kinase SRK [Arachis hypogaea]|uniref:putative inactive G-type lectin S-receptor-like serine/threonine-protein kinase SRK n=1 Tax=Arachis hypogaea TaxID=3818 RepID=UPI000DECA037|nr:putative inactive G-type lectin S-receptor-like serine/threonine-protein kinase SRK [Arachis hypogaea]
MIWSVINTECCVYGKCGVFASCDPKTSPICTSLRGYADLRIESADITAESAIRFYHSADRIISVKFGSDVDNYREYADIIRSMCNPTSYFNG